MEKIKVTWQAKIGYTGKQVEVLSKSDVLKKSFREGLQIERIDLIK